MERRRTSIYEGTTTGQALHLVLSLLFAVNPYNNPITFNPVLGMRKLNAEMKGFVHCHTAGKTPSGLPLFLNQFFPLRVESTEQQRLANLHSAVTISVAQA